MKIYFAGAIRGGREDAKLYESLILYLGQKGQVLTEHVADKSLSSIGELYKTDKEIFNRDIDWLISADIMVAEVSIPSLGVGYELGIAEKLNIPILCLYRSDGLKKLSAMINGNIVFTCREYKNLIDAKKYIDDFVD